MKTKINDNECPVILINFLNYLLGIKNYSICTINNYYLDLMIFFKFIKKYMNIQCEIRQFNIFVLANVKESDIIAYLVYLNYYKNNTAQTRQRRLSSVRTFYKWLFINHKPFNEKENPTKHIPNIERVERLPRYLSLENAQKIQNIFNLNNTKFPYRNNMIITLFLHTGIRLSELISININDINLKNNTIRIIGKNNKERFVYMDKVLRKKLKEYLIIRNKNKKIIQLNNALFLSYHGKRLGIDGIEDICQKAYKLMGLSEYGYTTHTLRHTAATLIYRKTRDLIVLKEFLGHAQLSTTEIYTHVINDEILEAVEKNPLNEYVELKVA